MSEFIGNKVPTDPWVVLALIILATLVLAYTASLVILRILKPAVAKLSPENENQIHRLLDKHLFPLMFIGALLAIIDVVPLPSNILRTSQALLRASIIVLVIFLAAKGALLFVRNLAASYEPMRDLRDLLETVVKVTLISLGGMIILDTLGVSITPLITTLGIGSLAVAIALQDTLSNFFAALYVKADRPVQAGHYVRLQSGEEGYVDHIGWRNTRVRLLSNNLVIVPNSKLLQSHITNYYLPEKATAVLVEVGVHYDSDLDKVERVTCAVAKEVLATVPGGVASFEPFIRFHTFNQSSIDFTVILRGREFTDGFLIKHEFIKKLHSRYRQEGIAIPFPIRTVHLQSATDDRHEKRASFGRPVVSRGDIRAELKGN
jgi:small-conductance mechanosensitive channel